MTEEQKKELAVMEKANELEKLEELQGQREQLAVALQDLDPETQRLVYPVLRLKMVQNILFAQLKESRKAGTSFTHAVRDRGLLRMLEKLRDEYPGRASLACALLPARAAMESELIRGPGAGCSADQTYSTALSLGRLAGHADGVARRFLRLY